MAPDAFVIDTVGTGRPVASHEIFTGVSITSDVSLKIEEIAAGAKWKKTSYLTTCN